MNTISTHHPNVESTVTTTMPTQTANPPVAAITGVLKWIAPELRDGCRAIAVLRDDETGPADANGRLPLTAVLLTKNLSERFDAALGEKIFRNYSRITITVRTEDLAADLAAGKGRQRHPYFIGVEIQFDI